MNLEQAIAILKDRAKFNRRSCEGYQSDFSVFCNEEAEAIDLALKELELAPKPEEGCEFCNGEKDIKKGDIEISAFEIRGKKHLTVVIFDDDCCGDEAIDEESFEINYCPMCGKRLTDD